MAKSKNNSEFFDLLYGALKEGVESLKAGQLLTVREVEMPDPPAEMSPEQIIALRTEKLGVSQRVFAAILNASTATVHSWEQGRKKPSGIALRLLRLLAERPEIVLAETMPQNRAG